jgi:hypothetical protein
LPDVINYGWKVTFFSVFCDENPFAKMLEFNAGLFASVDFEEDGES